MTIQNTRPENNDWQEPVGEQLSAPEISNPPNTPDLPLSERTEATTATQTGDAPVASDGDAPLPAESQVTQESGLFSFQTFTQQEAYSETPEQSYARLDASFLVSGTAVEEESSATYIPSPQDTTPVEDVAPALFPPENEVALPGAEDAVRPFMDFIEEFRQREVRLNALLSEEQETPFVAFVAETELANTAASLTELEREQVVDVPVDFQEAPEEVKKNKVEVEEARLSDESLPGLTQPTLPAERPVSPLLRPATRIRLPRHSRHRIEELIQPGEIQVEPVKPVVGPPAEQPPVASPPQEAEQPARPARRYRFDRPAASTSASLTPPKAQAPTTSTRGTSAKEKREGIQGTEAAAVRPANNGVATPAPVEVPTPKAPVQETASTSAEVETPAPTPTVSERRRRGSHDRQREKEQAAAQVTPIPEITVPEPEPVPAPVDEIALEDLPPLEYSELQAASSRRRRRRRAGSASTAAASNGTNPAKAVLPDLAAPAPAAPTSAIVPLPKTSPVAPVTPSVAAQSYNIVSGYTISQMNQGNDNSGPFMGPEPSPARGSTFSTSPALRHARGEALRATPSHPAKPGEASNSLISAASVNYLAQTVAQAVQTQTDRMVAELRRANQVPTSVSVSLPPFPSTERVGVFVDVANLLYSARTLRMTVDFGKLLDFLRGNRRLVRAQAYCPTSPQPGDDQMFLQAVKGLGYRITTKNYKTFSSGAKKADLDLDLCMDVVRLVDGRAVDCIVLVSGDSDFMPMLDYCSDHGVRVEVAAFDESMSATLRQSCDLFVNLSMLEEIRA